MPRNQHLFASMARTDDQKLGYRRDVCSTGTRNGLLCHVGATEVVLEQVWWAWLQKLIKSSWRKLALSVVEDHMKWGLFPFFNQL